MIGAIFLYAIAAVAAPKSDLSLRLRFAFGGWRRWFDCTCLCLFEPLSLSHVEVFDELLSSQGHALVWGLADQRGVGPHGQTVLLLMVTAPLPHPLTSIVCCFHMRACVALLRVACAWCLSSVPDLRDYRVWLGDSFNRQEISIAHVICGPEGSSLALMRLSQ